MKKLVLLLLFIFPWSNSGVGNDGMDLERLKVEILEHSQAYSFLTSLLSTGPRLSGSEGERASIRWLTGELKKLNGVVVQTQDVSVPHWVRGGIETAELIENTNADPVLLEVAALGQSAGTQNLTSEVIEVQTLKELEALGRTSVAGKIIFFNRPMDPTAKDPFEAYGQAGDQRNRGPGLASRFGAAGALVRSLTTLENDSHPHTGMTSFSRLGPPIPAAALSTRSANLLSKRLKANPHLKVRLNLSAQTFPDVLSQNIIADVKGSEHPEEIVLIGAHIDSWDLSPGAHDDGAGVAHVFETLRALSEMKIVPKRTLRAVFFVAEEPGGIGGDAYALWAKREGLRHIAAIESDRGGFDPLAFSFSGDSQIGEKLRLFLPDLIPLGIKEIKPGYGGTDIDPLDCPGIGFIPEASKYFNYHHSALDQIEAVKPDELARGTAAMAALAYLLTQNGL